MIRALRPRLRTLLATSLAAVGTAAACSPPPPPQAPPGETSAATSAAHDDASSESTNALPFACPPGPFPAPLSGEVTVAALERSEPTVLDATDTGFHLYEGAVWLDGALHFSDFVTTEGFPSRILRYVPGQGIEVAVSDSGSNGLALGPSGERLAAARHKSRSIAYFSDDRQSTTDIASAFEGKPFNSPNDLTFRRDGNVYFTDPDFQAGAQKPQPLTRVYRVDPSGVVSVVDDTITNPNGISLSPDQSTLYVAGNLEQGFVRSYPVAADGSVGPGTTFLPGVTVPDGMAVDCAGNVYVTEHTNRRIRVVSPEGREIGQIVGMDANVTNAAFGGPERRTLFITGTGRLWALNLPVPGFPY